MASSKPEIKKPGTGGPLLAPSKFGANFGRSETKRLFTGLKASKLTSITQSVCSSSVVPAPPQPQQSPASQTASGTIPSPKSFTEHTGPNQVSSCTPVISKVTLNASPSQPISPQKKETAEKPKETSPFELKPSEGKGEESSGFVFGQNCADRAENFAEASSVEGANASGDGNTININKTSPQPSSGFVFGENLADRISKNDKDLSEKDGTGKNVGENYKSTDAQLDESESSKTEISPPLSANVSKSLNPDVSERQTLTSPDKDNSNASSKKTHEQTTALSCKTLHENAAEYFESHLAPPKRKYDEVEVITGEENEHNVLHMSAKLYLFDKNKCWLEKGRGELRLNDLSVAAANASNNTACLSGTQASRDVKRKVMSSRIVMRTVGSLRVILNTKVYHGMSVEKPNEKSVRLTGMDDGVVKVFLINGSPKDADALHCALKSRLAELKSTQEEVSKLETVEDKDNQIENEMKCSDNSSKKTKKIENCE